MADDASVSIQATILPDEIAKTLTGSMTVTPADANDKWYYKLTACTNASTDLIAGNFLDYTPVDDDTAPTAVHVNDKVKFLFVKNESTADGIYLVLDGGTASNSVADGIFIGAGQTFVGRFPNTTVGNLHAIASDIADVGDANVTAIVAALIDDVA